ncbi:uncharacterized protein LOC124925590 [Impatiens glandulifera]|uniref:uncharacterized protein LOC124925590 n=1 Tax=Impatiens glandulifera TaxID=253017 RepID=UPI001FB0728C|nr:uncharacterized protein LOC124925590 [Impatiens glandulifera]
MGMIMSLMGKGSPSNQMLNLVTGTLYHRFLDKDIKSFEDFHLAILDIFNTFNSALPGKHYDAPSRQLVEECFAKWKEGGTKEERKEIFVEFVRRNASLSKLDNSSIITGLVTPPAAMVVKKAGEKVPQLSMVKVIPDVIFVPSATVLALVFVKLSRRIFPKNVSAVPSTPETA